LAGMFFKYASIDRVEFSGASQLVTRSTRHNGQLVTQSARHSQLLAVISSCGLHLSKVHSRCNTDRQKLKRLSK